MIQNLIDIFTAPSAVFARLKEKPTLWVPLIVFALIIGSVQLGYFLLMDAGFVADQVVELQTDSSPNITDEQAETLRNTYVNNPALLAIASCVQYAIGIFIALAFYALYLNFASKFYFVQFGWKAWMSLLVWTRAPLLLTALASWVAILGNSNGQLPLTASNPLSLSNLLGIGAVSTPLGTITPLHFWWLALLAMGYQQWTGKGMLASLLITAVPFVLFFGIWGAFTGFV